MYVQQAPVLHDCVRVVPLVASHPLPPLAANVVMRNVCTIEPPPHDFEQTAYADGTYMPTQPTGGADLVWQFELE